MFDLSRKSKILRVENSAGTGTSELQSDSVDMSEWKSVTFIAAFGSVSPGAATVMKLQQSSDDGVVDAWSDLQGSATDALIDPGDNKIVIIHLMHPAKRYVRAVVNRSAGNSALDGIVAIQGYPIRPTISGAHASVGASKILRTPVEGIA